MQLQNNQWKNIWTAQLAWNVLETQARGEKPKAVLMSQSGCALATSEGLGIPSGYWSLPMLKSCFTTLINNLSVKHTIGQQMILFHRFSDLMNYSLTLYPRCWSGERLLKRKRQRNFNMYHTQARVHERFLFQKDFFFFCSFFSPLSPTHISSTLSTSAEWELPGADKSPVICQTSPACPVLLFSCILLSVIESEKLSIWIRSSTCEKHSMASFFSCQRCWITPPLVAHTLGPDVQDNVTVKLQRKMVTGVKTNLQLGFCDVFYFVGCLTVEVNCCILVATSRFVHALRLLASLDGGRRRLFIEGLWWPQLDRVAGGNTAAYTGGSWLGSIKYQSGSISLTSWRIRALQGSRVKPSREKTNASRRWFADFPTGRLLMLSPLAIKIHNNVASLWMQQHQLEPCWN